MTNAFFNRSFDVSPGATARSSPVEDEIAAIGVGFDRVETKTNAAFRAPDGETPTALPAAASRASKAFVFDSSGNPTVATTATSPEMDAAVAAAASASASAAAAAASASTVAGATNTLHMLQLQAGVL